jgi:hypothetical protein
MNILDREISNALNCVRYQNPNGSFDLNLTDIERVMLEYFNSHRCDRKSLAVELLKPTEFPEWANYIAMDNNGSWFCFESKPMFDSYGQWVLPNGGRFNPCSKFDGSQTLELVSGIDPLGAYEHITKKSVYKIIGFGKMVCGDEWVESVSYSRLLGTDSVVYTQPKSRFLQKFRKLPD